MIIFVLIIIVIIGISGPIPIEQEDVLLDGGQTSPCCWCGSYTQDPFLVSGGPFLYSTASLSLSWTAAWPPDRTAYVYIYIYIHTRQ